MSFKRHNSLTVSTEWAKHLRPHGKALYWNREKMAAKQDIKKRILDSRP